MPTGNEFLKRMVERGSGFLTVISPEHRNYEEGGAYVATGILTNLSAGASTYLQMRTCAIKTTAVKGVILSADVLVKVELFEEPTLTTGTVEMPIVQRDRTKTALYTCGTKIYTNPTNITATGTLLKTVIGGSGTFTNPVGVGVDTEMKGFNFKKNTNYLLKLTNLANSTSEIIHFEQEIYMIAPRTALW